MVRSYRAGLSTAAVVEAALAIIDEQGPAALTLAAVAQRTGVAAPSLYKHVGSLAELRTLVGARVLEEMTERFTRAVIGRSGDDAVEVLMRDYRAYVTAHPARYAATPADPLHDPRIAEAGQRLLEVFLAVLRGYGLTDSDAIHTTRCVRAVVHGFASIEASGGFGLPEDLDETYARLIRMTIAGLPR
ncbi:TetR/AcrR family transcriptional regulator [Phytohabitans sp. ZYX-F-186]|uniref:TetR/AcrR family transcriptional regulator n=1 Tax=Phytohabitans maris TaxID=3071409 RepID=A0ABU0ZUK5_9ACTN|nr:TetR/AcrR family transcriptional regulator [Phytohabitans sp. ZYX-F-186]MDQ7910728.1 TetR/AcrR family transcriptional regulator [Phytohabitans sp. ZYX-F-186]